MILGKFNSRQRCPQTAENCLFPNIQYFLSFALKKTDKNFTTREHLLKHNDGRHCRVTFGTGKEITDVGTSLPTVLTCGTCGK